MNSDEIKELVKKAFEVQKQETGSCDTQLLNNLLKFVDETKDNVFEGKRLNQFNYFLLQFIRFKSLDSEIYGEYEINKYLNAGIFYFYLTDEQYECNKLEVFKLIPLCEGVHIDYVDNQWRFQFEIYMNDKMYN